MEKEYTLAERTYASGTVIPTVKESYDDGYRTGFFWPDPWESHARPGGPGYYNDSYSYKENKQRKIWELASRAAHDAWHKGYRNGHEAKLFLKQYGITLPQWASIELARPAMNGHIEPMKIESIGLK